MFKRTFSYQPSSSRLLTLNNINSNRLATGRQSGPSYKMAPSAENDESTPMGSVMQGKGSGVVYASVLYGPRDLRLVTPPFHECHRHTESRASSPEFLVSPRSLWFS